MTRRILTILAVAALACAAAPPARAQAITQNSLVSGPLTFNTTNQGIVIPLNGNAIGGYIAATDATGTFTCEFSYDNARSFKSAPTDSPCIITPTNTNNTAQNAAGTLSLASNSNGFGFSIAVLAQGVTHVQLVSTAWSDGSAAVTLSANGASGLWQTLQRDGAFYTVPRAHNIAGYPLAIAAPLVAVGNDGNYHIVGQATAASPGPTPLPVVSGASACPLRAVISAGTGTTAIVLNDGGPNYITVCTLLLNTTGTQSWGVEEGTGTTCAWDAGTAATVPIINGLSNDAGTGAFNAASGINGWSSAPVFTTTNYGDSICVTTDGGPASINGFITYRLSEQSGNAP